MTCVNELSEKEVEQELSKQRAAVSDVNEALLDLSRKVACVCFC